MRSCCPVLLINIAITNLWLYEAEYTFLDIYNDSVFLSLSWISHTDKLFCHHYWLLFLLLLFYLCVPSLS
ncbi:hypothetical protein VDIAB_271059 [Vibrio diabolicus]|nr:hypothetical protein VDIAB_271059 [Vibrio diabolicus]